MCSKPFRREGIGRRGAQVAKGGERNEGGGERRGERLGEGGGLLAFSIRRALSLRGSCRRLFCIHFHYCFFVCVFSKPREATCLLACTLLVSIVFIV